MSWEKEIDDWKKRTRRKGQMFILSSVCFFYDKDGAAKEGTAYFVIQKEKDRVKLAIFRDGMLIRYGCDTLGVLRGKNISGIWQSSSGRLTEDQINSMIEFAKGNLNLPEFDPDILQDVSI